ncbi:TetR/AcrR family transcriptional regulator [Asanoa sp. WMMD1127]|uniref:TetR/AcrR family transcriptional regulator n=1 Tax=Asanoa sp. WMMD1127 TaxID=3016107 RepID=UPI002415E9EE|nr:TetR/AcrR family transcriptional regulator [Asanoa sp. WMMD1127]MDG4824371.1 TetR/AcrR family transcriptional regulator [Asanoa sp. WMMD1127]
MNTERPLRADARRNREKVMTAARAAFTEHGEKATLDDIARRAGVGPGTLYRHFADRETLLATVYRHDIEALAERGRALSAQHPPGEAFAEWLRLEFEYIKAKRGLGTAVKQMLGTDSPTMVECKSLMRGAIGDLLVRAQETGDIRKDVEPDDVLRLVHGVVMATQTAPEQADRLLGFVLDGLRA